jgi:hypothetical protein
MGQSLRARMEEAVERLIAALDAMEAPGEDLEPQGDEEPGGEWGPVRGGSERAAG